MTTSESTPTPAQAPATPPAAVKTAKPVKAATPLAAAAAKKPAVQKTPARKAPAKVAEKKVSAVSKAAPLKPAATTSSVSEKNAKLKKPKLVRDSFTIPKDEYVAIEMLKQRAAALAHPIKKSELLRAGLKVLAGMSDTALRNALKAVPLLKTGRPKTEEPTQPVVNTKSTTKATNKK